MDINNMTRKQFDELPARKWDEDIGEFDTLIILPLRRLHDSGYRLMDFVAVKNGKPIARLSGCSDVVHIDGIGGYGYKWSERCIGVPNTIPISGWSIDCLPKSGLLRLFSNRKITADPSLSSFSIYATNREGGKIK